MMDEAKIADIPADDDALRRAYDAVAQAMTRPPTTRDLPPEERRAYLRELKRRSRAKAKAAAEAGRLEDRADIIRDVLADAALILLATGAPGADAIERLLGKAFVGRAGLPGRVRAQAKAGSLKPKMLTPELLRGGGASS